MSKKPIVYLEKDEAWLFDGENFKPCDFTEVKKHEAGASIPLSKIQVGSFKFSSSLSDTELQIQTEIKMHEEGGLDVEREYEISSFNHVLEVENSTLVEALAASHEQLSECCADLVKKSKVIDWIVPSFITYSSYYVYNEVEAKTDLFFYLGDNESYAVLFNEGVYIAHRKMLSIEEFAKESGLDEKRCKTLLSKYGLLEDACPEEEKVFISALQTSFSKQVEKVVHTINHKRGLFGIEGIDRIFVDFQGHDLAGLEMIFAAYGMENLEMKSLVCQKADVEHSHRFIKAMYIYLCANGLLPNPLNLSPYERQPIWYKRHSGHLVMVSAAAVLLSLLHPGYFYVQSMLYDEKIEVLETRITSMQAEVTSLSVKLKGLQAEVKKSRAKVQAVNGSNKVYQLTIDTLPLLMNKRNIRQKMLYDALEMLRAQNLSTISLDQNGTDSMIIHVIADYSSRDKIAKFMKAWMQSGYKEARTQEIYLDENIYESKIEVFR